MSYREKNYKLIDHDLAHHRRLLLMSPLATARDKHKSSYKLSKQKHEGELITATKIRKQNSL